MSSYDGGGFEEWLRDSMNFNITDDVWQKLLAVLEPHRALIDRWCDDYDEETQSWRDYRNSLWTLLPDDVSDHVEAILREVETKRRLTSDPRTLHWIYGPLPDVDKVPFDRMILFWSPEHVGIVTPTGDKLNPLRWGDSSGHPRWGKFRPTGWWTVIREGSAKRPDDVKTWDEFFKERGVSP